MLWTIQASCSFLGYMNTIDQPRKSHDCIFAQFCNRNVYTFAHLCYQAMYGGIWEWCIVGFGQLVRCRKLACIIDLSCSSLKRFDILFEGIYNSQFFSNSSHVRVSIHALWSVWIFIFIIYPPPGNRLISRLHIFFFKVQSLYLSFFAQVIHCVYHILHIHKYTDNREPPPPQPCRHQPHLSL